MSKYSGKCDFYDHIEMCKNEEEVLNTKIYIGNSETPLNIHSMVDLIPYYPHIIYLGVYNGENNIVRLTEKPYTDIEEEEHLQFYLDTILRYYRKCKRKKEEFNVETAIENLRWISCKDVIRTLAERVKKDGKKATYEGLHLPFEDYYRKELVNEMLKNGLDPKEYGYGRFCE